MRHYSYSEEPSFLILHKENSEMHQDPKAEPKVIDKVSQQTKLSALTNENTSVFFSNLIKNTGIITANDGELFMKLDVIPDNIANLVEAFLERHPLNETLKLQLEARKRELESELHKLLENVPDDLQDNIISYDEDIFSTASGKISGALAATSLGVSAAAAVGVIGLLPFAASATATLGAISLANAAVDYLVNDPNGLEILKLRNNTLKIDSIISELFPKEKIQVPSISSSVQTSSSEKKQIASSSISQRKPSGLIVLMNQFLLLLLLLPLPLLL
jgi:hypothetical protein